MRRAIRGGKVVTPTVTLDDAAVLLNGGGIVEVLPAHDQSLPIQAELDASGLVVAPAFIELQINGGFGDDLTTDPEAIWRLGRRLPEIGVGSFLPTIISSAEAGVDRALEVLQAGPPLRYQGATPLGLHLEGPFLAPAQRGAHDIASLRPPDLADIGGWSTREGVRMVTLAPELPGALELIHELVARGIVVSAGHSDATLSEAHAAIEAGVTYGTHLFNAMSGLDHRSPGLAAALLLDERVTVGLIADGIHVHPELVRLAWGLARPDRLSLISDAMAGLGMPAGSYRLGSGSVRVSPTDARLEDGTLAGSVLALDQAIRNLRSFTGCTLEEALGTVTAVPARLLGLAARLGGIGPGAAADLVLLTDQLEVVATIIGGDLAYAIDGAPAWQ